MYRSTVNVLNFIMSLCFMYCGFGSCTATVYVYSTYNLKGTVPRKSVRVFDLGW
jgi:hypothetical protein